MSSFHTNTHEAPCHTDAAVDDRGQALILVLVMIIIATLIVIPTLNYAIAVTRSSRTIDYKVQRVEATKAGLRTVLADPVALYKACDPLLYGPTNGLVLASPPGLPTPVKTTCYVMKTNFAEDADKRPYGVVAVQANSVLPTIFTSPPRADVYPRSGNTDANYWWVNDKSSVRIKDKIWAPDLPVHALSPRAATPYSMDTSGGFAACKVYFPGTYTDPIAISGPTPTYFASGIYYFENTVTITGTANVVVGGGSKDGCTTDQEAAFYAVDAPTSHNITGLGATFVFGMAGRLIVNDTGGTTVNPLSIVFNQRYVAADDTNNLPSANVSILSVNGELPGSDLANGMVDLVRTGVLAVPKSRAPSGSTFADATLNKYRPSTLVPPDPAIVPAPADSAPIIDISFGTTTAATIAVPGYVSVPQGRFRLNIPAGQNFASNKAVNFSGGLLARTIEIPGDNPASFSITVADVIIQLVLRIKTVTTTGVPLVTSDAIVQVNKNGSYAVNSWNVQ